MVLEKYGADHPSPQKVELTTKKAHCFAQYNQRKAVTEKPHMSRKTIITLSLKNNE